MENAGVLRSEACVAALHSTLGSIERACITVASAQQRATVSLLRATDKDPYMPWVYRGCS